MQLPYADTQAEGELILMRRPTPEKGEGKMGHLMLEVAQMNLLYNI